MFIRVMEFGIFFYPFLYLQMFYNGHITFYDQTKSYYFLKYQQV